MKSNIWPDQLHFLVLPALFSSQKLPQWVVLNAKINPRKYQQRIITSDHSSCFFCYPTYRTKPIRPEHIRSQPRRHTVVRRGKKKNNGNNQQLIDGNQRINGD